MSCSIKLAVTELNQGQVTKKKVKAQPLSAGQECPQYKIPFMDYLNPQLVESPFHLFSPLFATMMNRFLQLNEDCQAEIIKTCMLVDPPEIITLGG